MNDLGEAESDLARLERENEALRESLIATQHRMRNTLAVIRSIARRSAETSDSVETYAMHLDGRIGALARVQAALLRDPDSGMSLETLVADSLLSVLAREGDRVAIQGPGVTLRGKTAEQLGLAFHELATNAVKFGALSNGRGRVAVEWARDRDDLSTLVICWRETGSHTSAATSTRRGFGTEFLQSSLAYELDARTDFQCDRGGLACTIRLPARSCSSIEDGLST